jgi:serine/threonine protein kinase/tetratricopeptide (TPR) repeat protein
VSAEEDPGVTADDPGVTFIEPGGKPLVLHSEGPGASLMAAAGSQLAFSRYPLIRRLGRGGAGEVFLAYDPRLDRKVAIKILTASGLVGNIDSLGKTRLLREAQAMARSPHPNVVSVYDVDTYQNDSGESGVFIVMEYVEGPNLAEWYAKKKWRWRRVLRMLLAAGRGLAAAHEVGVVHRDFKPANVLVGADGRVRVLDFGLARGTANMAPSLTDGERPLVEPDPEEDFDRSPLDVTLTMAGRVLGTPAYMAPEQHRGALADERADQFAFCATLWEGLYGERPFKAKTFAALEEEKRTQTPVPVEGVRVPAWIREALVRGMSAHADDRWPSMQALLAALRRGTVRRRRSGGALAGVASIALAVGGGWLFSSPNEAMCVGGERLVAERWELPRRKGIERSLANGHPKGPDYASASLAKVDEYWESWTRQYDENCEATRVMAIQPDGDRELRAACLDRHARHLDASLSQLEMGHWEPDRWRHAFASVIAHLPELDDCRNLEALRVRVQEPEGRPRAADARELRDELSRIGVLVGGGRVGDALARAEAAVERAQEFDEPAVLAEALIVRGDAEALGGRRADAARTQLDAYATALACGHDEAAARAATHLVYGRRADRVRIGALRSWSKIAAAQLERSELSEIHHVDLLVVKADAYVRAGRFDEGATSAGEALEILDRMGRADDPRRASSLVALSVAERDLGQTGDAQRHADQALDMLVRLYGDGHPEIRAATDRLERPPSGASSTERGAGSAEAGTEAVVDVGASSSVESMDDVP